MWPLRRAVWKEFQFSYSFNFFKTIILCCLRLFFFTTSYRNKKTLKNAYINGIRGFWTQLISKKWYKFVLSLFFSYLVIAYLSSARNLYWRKEKNTKTVLDYENFWIECLVKKKTIFFSLTSVRWWLAT